MTVEFRIAPAKVSDPLKTNVPVSHGVFLNNVALKQITGIGVSKRSAGTYSRADFTLHPGMTKIYILPGPITKVILAQ